MIEKIANRVSGEKSVDHRIGQTHSQTRCCDARSQFVIVCKIVEQGFKTANLLQILLADCESRAKTETYPALNFLGDQYAGGEIGCYSKRLQPRPEGCSGNPAIKLVHEADCWVGKWRNYALQVVWFHANVAVVYDEMVVPCHLGYLCQIADLDVRTQNSRADEEPDLHLGKFLLQALNQFTGRII